MGRGGGGCCWWRLVHISLCPALSNTAPPLLCLSTLLHCFLTLYPPTPSITPPPHVSRPPSHCQMAGERMGQRWRGDQWGDYHCLENMDEFVRYLGGRVLCQPALD